MMLILGNTVLLIQAQLFATLDTTTRSLDLEKSHRIILSDKVGLVRKLPHHLIASFKSTLKEVLDADLILVVLDGSSKQVLEHYKTYMQVLIEFCAERHPLLKVVNKIDHEYVASQLAYLNRTFAEGIFISSIATR